MIRPRATTGTSPGSRAVPSSAPRCRLPRCRPRAARMACDVRDRLLPGARLGGRRARRARPRAARGRDGPARAASACSPGPAPARPARSPTGSPTACQSGVYNPQRVLAVTFTARAAGEMRRRLRDARRRRRAGPDLPRRRAAPAALLLAAGTSAAQPPRAARAQGRRWSPRRPRGCGCRSTGPRCATWRPRSSGPRSACSTPRLRRGGRRPRHAGPGGLDPPTVARLLEAYEQVKRDRGVIDFEDVLLLTVGLLAGAPRRSPTRSASQYRHFVVDEYQDVSPLQQRAARPLARRPRRPLRRRRPEPDHLLLHRRQPAYLLELRPAPPAAPPWSGWSATTGRPRRWSALANGCSARAGGRAATARLELRRPAAARARAASSPSTPTTSAEAAGRRDGGSRADRRRARRPARSPCCSGPTPSPRPTSRRWPTPACPTWCAAASGSSPPEVREAVLLLRGAARAADDAGGARCRPVRASWPRSAGRRAPPAGAGAVRERWESLPALVGARRRPGRGRPGRRPRATWCRAGRAGRRPARADRRGRDAGVAARRQGPGVGRGLPRRAHRGLAADHATPRAATRSRRSAGCSTSASPGPASTCACPGRWPARRAAAPRASPSRFLDGLLADGPPLDAARPGREPRDGGRGRPLPTTCRTCGTRSPTGAERKLGRCASCPPTYDEELFERLRAWRLGGRGRGEGAGVRRLHRRHADRHRRDAAPATWAGWPRVPGRRPAQAGAVRRAGPASFWRRR